MNRFSSIGRLAIAALLTAAFATPLLADGPAPAPLFPVTAAYGEATAGFPSWEERVIQQLTNRARVEPSADLAACTGCSSAELSPGCYTPMAPLSHNSSVNRAARFHSAFMAKTGVLSHSNGCVLFSNIGSLYPDSCDGSFACSCSASGTTGAQQRIGLFLGFLPAPMAENIGRGYPTPHSIFYAWLLEPSPTATCSNYYASPTDYNGHRWNILKTTAASIGAGFHRSASNEEWWTQDFAPGTAPSSLKLVSGTHWSTSSTRQGPTVEFWANWYSSSAPSVANVVINGTPYAMTRARGTNTNGSWTVSRTDLATGCHRYYFSFQEGSTTYRYPGTGTLGVGNPSVCPDWVDTPAFVRGDFNLDGRADLLWRNYSTGDVNAWFLNGTTYAGGANLYKVPDANWRIETVGDFNGDGRSDLIWRNYSTGDVNVWYMNGSTYIGGANLYKVPDLNWRIETAGDFNGDGKDDLIWRNYATGAVNAWFLNGATYVSGANLYTVADPNWKIEGSGDFNGDGKRDLLWRNYATGAVNVWFLNGTTYVSGANLYTVPDPQWKIEAIGDYNGDGKLDLIWRNYATGAVNAWFLNGTTYLGGAALYSVPDPNWKIAGPR
jgi:hypothetical protein